MNRNSLKWALVASCWLLLLSQAFSVSLTLNKETFQKGEDLVLTGNASGMVTVSAVSAGRQVFERKQPLQKDLNIFAFSRQISMLDPKGTWEITVSDANSSTKKEIIVNPTRESEFLVLTFLSPSEGSYTRTSMVNLAVRITDAGKAVTDGIAYAWDAMGTKIRLNNNGDGTYSAAYKLLPETPLGPWQAKVTAIRESRPEEIGGENSAEVEIDATPLALDMIEPHVEEFEVGKQVPIKLKLSYLDGSVVKNAAVTVTANYQLLALREEGLGVYSSKFIPEISEDQLVEIRVDAKDGFGNTGQKRLNLKPTGYWMHIVKENAVFYAFPLVFISYILFLTVKEIGFFLRRMGLRKRKQQLLLQKKKLQEDFYAKNILSKQTYDLRNAELNTELNEVRGRLDLLEQGGN